MLAGQFTKPGSYFRLLSIELMLWEDIFQVLWGTAQVASHKIRLHPDDAMHITFYRSALCPRCHIAKRYLFGITSKIPGITVENVDIATAPLRTWKDGIRMIPAIKIDSRILSGVLLSRDNIADFIAHRKSWHDHILYIIIISWRISFPTPSVASTLLPGPLYSAFLVAVHYYQGGIPSSRLPEHSASLSRWCWSVLPLRSS